MNRFNKRLVAVAALFTIGSASAAPILLLQGTALIGAAGVEVNGVLYDVSFQDGSYNSLYPKGLVDVPFQDKAFVTSAIYALNTQVFTGVYDDNPALTRGCAHSLCTMLTPFNDPRLGITMYGFANYAPTISADGYSYGGINRSMDTSNFHTYTYATWSPSTAIAPVPEPSSIAMMGLGLAALAFVHRRTRNA